MQISLITRLASAALVTIVIIMTGSIFWSLERLDNAFKQQEYYHLYKETIHTQLEQPISTYLRTGDATLLTLIESNLVELLKDQNQENSSELKQKTTPLLKEIESKDMAFLRSAGKLAQPSQLLIHNEREINDNLVTLHDYAQQASFEQSELKSQYIDQLLIIRSNLVKLIHARQIFFLRDNDASFNQAITQIQETKSSIKKLNTLPKLGIYSENADSGDDLASLLGLNIDDTETNKEEISEEPLSALNSLINRYNKELDNARSLKRKKETANQQAQSSITNLNTTINELSNIISAQYEDVRLSVYYLMSICVLLILATGIAINYLLRRLGKIIVITTSYIDQLSHGYFSRKVEIESNIAEAKTLSGSILRLQGFFNKLMLDIRSESTMLNNLQQQATDQALLLSNTTMQQQEATESSVLQISQLNESFIDVSTRATQTSQATQEATTQVTAGFEKIKDTRDCIDRLNTEISETARSLNELQKDSIAIQDALSVIQGFAERTNLLALNAAIEAARAGETGRGFAVVADEVRNLAANTAKSADQIQTITDRLRKTTNQTVEKMSTQQNAADQTVTLASQAEGALELIKTSISEINEMSRQIAASTEEQTATTQNISVTLDGTKALAHSSSSVVEANKQQATELSSTSRNLSALIDTLQ